MLETVTDPTKTNIHYLNLEEPQRQDGFPGDVREWIGQYDLQMMALLEEISGSDWAMVNDSKRAALILFPERFPVKLLDKERAKRITLRALHENIDELRSMHLHYFRTAANIKFLFPEEEFLNASDWNKVTSDLRTVKSVFHTHETYFMYAAGVKMLDSQKARQFDLDNDDAWQEGLNVLEADRENNSWFFFLTLAAYMKTLNPEKFKTFQITDQDWKKIKNAFQNQLAKGHDLLANAGDILTLQADEIRLSPERIEVIMPEQKHPIIQDTPQLPEVRKF